MYLLRSGKDTDSSALEEEGDDLKALEAKIRCLGMKKKPSQGTLIIIVDKRDDGHGGGDFPCNDH